MWAEPSSFARFPTLLPRRATATFPPRAWASSRLLPSNSDLKFRPVRHIDHVGRAEFIREVSHIASEESNCHLPAQGLGKLSALAQQLRSEVPTGPPHRPCGQSRVHSRGFPHCFRGEQLPPSRPGPGQALGSCPATPI